MNVLFLVLGGSLGAICRYAVLKLTYFTAEHIYFAATVLFINSTGSFLVGFLFSVLQALDIKWGSSGIAFVESARVFLIVGFLGSYTTFSTYALDSMQFFLDGQIKKGLVNIILNNGISFLFVLIGLWLGKKIFTV